MKTTKLLSTEIRFQLLLYFSSSWFNTGAEIPKWVHRVDACPEPHNLTAWNLASKRLNCLDNLSSPNPQRVYHCIPSSFLNETLEFCGPSKPNYGGECPVYTYNHIQNVAPDFKSCRNFTDGCPKEHYQSKDVYKYPECVNINKKRRCYTADPECKAKARNNEDKNDKINNDGLQRNNEDKNDKINNDGLQRGKPLGGFGIQLTILILVAFLVISMLILGVVLGVVKGIKIRCKRDVSYTGIPRSQAINETNQRCSWPGYPGCLNEEVFEKYSDLVKEMHPMNMVLNVLRGKYGCNEYIELLKGLFKNDENLSHLLRTTIQEFIIFSQSAVKIFNLEDTDLLTSIDNRRNVFLCAVNSKDLCKRAFEEIKEELSSIRSSETECNKDKVFVLLILDMEGKSDIKTFYDEPESKMYSAQLANGIGFNMSNILPQPINTSDQLSSFTVTLINFWKILSSVSEDP